MADEVVKEKQVSLSILQKRWKKFKTLKRGYYAFLIITTVYVISFILPLFVGRDALLLSYDGNMYFPLFKTYQATDLGQKKDPYGEANYRILNQEYKDSDQGNWVLMPLYPFGPNENLLNELEGNPPHTPSLSHWAGTDDRGRDVFARLVYGFNIGISFSLVVTVFSFIIGIAIGAILGFFGGKVDIIGQRLIEIWGTLPFLYVIIIISSIIQPNFLLLVLILTLFDWIFMTYYMRGEFYREKARDYVSAAVSMGAKNKTIIFKHILPNSLTPVISYAPFIIVANIFQLVSLDYLGFGLPPPTPSWGQLMQQGLSNIDNWWLIMTPLASMFFTLLAITFVGEAIREAFDPKVYSRLR
ncbi:MAG: ABC transporter permease subunit [Ignavibacteria bacterium]